MGIFLRTFPHLEGVTETIVNQLEQRIQQVGPLYTVAPLLSYTSTITTLIQQHHYYR